MRTVSMVLTLAALLGFALSSKAFCRTTTCHSGDCKPSADCPTCLEGGRPLYWKSRCLSVAVSSSGSAKWGILPQQAHGVISGAFVKWLSADCQGDRPSLEVLDLGAVSCDTTEYERAGRNLNLWTFRDQSWPHMGRGLMLALTTVTYDADSGEILDADVEINSFQNEVTVGDDFVFADLDAIVTHESGHFLGLAHSCDVGATMSPSYSMGTTEMRSLEKDDEAAVCAAFPPGIKKVCAPEPRGGLSKCVSDESAEDVQAPPACSLARGPGDVPVGAFLALALPLAWLRRQRRRR